MDNATTASTYVADAVVTNSSPRPTQRFEFALVFSELPPGFKLDIPLAIPRSQGYYWTREWQDAENRMLMELRAGESRRFESGTAAIRWLLSEDD